MKVLYLLLIMALALNSFGQNNTKVYLLPGQGSDERLFSKIQLDSTFETVNIALPVPEKGMKMKEFAHIVSKQIDTTENFILIGTSMGGMVCCELAEFLKPEKVIIISSAKCRSELPFRYRFQHKIPLNKIVPKRLVKIGAQILQPIVEPDRKLHKDIFKSMLKAKTPFYYKWTVNMIINWEKETCNENIIHIHGTKDHTLPIRNIKANYIIDNGSHMMTLTRGEEINKLINEILKVDD